MSVLGAAREKALRIIGLLQWRSSQAVYKSMSLLQWRSFSTFEMGQSVLKEGARVTFKKRIYSVAMLNHEGMLELDTILCCSYYVAQPLSGFLSQKILHFIFNTERINLTL